MTSDHPAICVRGLGKKYQIGGPQEKYLTFRDAITNSFKAPFKRFTSQGAPPEFWALKDVSFDVEQGEVVGIIGRNGAGKSTLLKILSRITTPTEGTVDLYGRVGSLLEVGTGFHPELTGRENIFLSGSILGMKKREIEDKLDEIVKFSEIEKFLETPVKRYSSGMYVRLAFAVAAHLEPEILLVDEVLAVGDAAFQKKCLGKMGEVAKEGRTVLFVSHNMAAINSLCNKAILLNAGLLKKQGPTIEVINEYLGDYTSNVYQVFFEQDVKKMLQVRSIWISDMECNQRDTFLDDQEILVHSEIECHYNSPEVYFGLIIKNSQGIPVLFADSRDNEKSSLPHRFEKGLFCIFLKIPPVLSPDRYTLSMGIATRQPVEDIDQIESACTFEVANNSNIQRTAKRPSGVNLKIPWMLKK